MTLTKANAPSNTKTDNWSNAIYEIFIANQIRQVVYVPDAGHSGLINLCHADANIDDVVLSSEEEGVAHIAGAWLGGDRGIMLMQSSGVGNCVNMFSLITSCKIPFLTLITMRGEWGEFNPWQLQMGQTTPELLKLCGLIVHRIDEIGQLEDTLDSALRIAFDGSQGVAVLLSQRLIGRKDFIGQK